MPKTRDDYTYLAARQAFDWAGEAYADYIQEHIDGLERKGYRVSARSFAELIEGNDGN